MIRLICVSCLCALLVEVGVAAGDTIPYPQGGTYLNTSYSFTATNSTDVIGYFSGSDARDDNRVGMRVNGTLTSAGYGLDDHSSSIGQAFDFGHVNAGDTIVFDLWNLSLSDHVYSDPSLNSAYDVSGETIGHNHLYSTPYTATTPIFAGVPAGTYLAFEDQRFPNTDYSYADENFVFSNIQVVPEPSSLLILETGAIIVLTRRKRTANVG